MASKVAVREGSDRLAFLPLLAVAGSSVVALIVYVLSGTSLSVALAVTVATSTGAAAWMLRRSSGADRSRLARRVWAGAAAGAVATLVYDVLRLAVVKLFGFRLWPFHVLELFGQALVGSGRHGPLVWLAGGAFHVANGIGLGIAYALLFRPSLRTGVAWALTLEVAMVSLYTPWLDLSAVLDEFFTVSLIGHLGYGTILWRLTSKCVGP